VSYAVLPNATLALETFLDANHISALFDHVLNSSRVGLGASDIGGYLYALEILGRPRHTSAARLPETQMPQMGHR
jgi:hypothetical protein